MSEKNLNQRINDLDVHIVKHLYAETISKWIIRGSDGTNALRYVILLLTLVTK